jgi:hypothetical protein
MFGVGGTEMLVFATVVYFYVLWRFTGPPRWK